MSWVAYRDFLPIYFCYRQLIFALMNVNSQQNQEVIEEIKRLNYFFETTPILIREWKEGCMLVRDIPAFIKAQVNAALTFNTTHYFNPPLMRLQQLEQAVKNQISN